jgi:hypothetical protein
MNFRGEPWYFFVFKPEVDIHVSGSMLRNGGNEKRLHPINQPGTAV